MSESYPEWANKKQVEGMRLFKKTLEEYLWNMEVSFKETDYEMDDENSRFYAVVSWESESKGSREHTFDIAYDYEPLWNCYGERIREWQFLFSGGDATREISNEIIFMELFFYLDKSATIAA